MKIDGEENLTDTFTKAPRIKEFDYCKWKMGIRYYSDWIYSKWEWLEIVSQSQLPRL